MNLSARAPFPFPAYYDHRVNHYLMDAEHGWTQLVKDDLRIHMQAAGWDNDKRGGQLSALDHELMRIQLENKIDFAGPVAGHKKGLVAMAGSRVLVTQSYQPVKVSVGPWPLLSLFLENLFDRIDPLQKPVFFSWCQVYLRSLKANIFMPGQALILAGPHKCGKSFLQNRLTVLFGGRAANPWPYISETTAFNSELFGCEHMQVEDPSVSNLVDRLSFGSKIKQFTVNEIQPCHGKRRDIVTIQPRWRVTISINDEPYNLRAIPPIDDSTADKVNIMRCAANSVPFDDSDIEKREKFRLAVDEELGHFAHFLLNEWEVPEKLKSGRFGVTHYHHPEILREINEQSPEFDLLNTFDENDIFDKKPFWTGTIKQLTSKLMEYVGDPESLKLGRSERALQLKMSSLLRKYPERVSFHRSKTHRLWTIANPNAPKPALQ